LRWRWIHLKRFEIVLLRIEFRWRMLYKLEHILSIKNKISLIYLIWNLTKRTFNTFERDCVNEYLIFSTNLLFLTIFHFFHTRNIFMNVR
jgi:hypothetical protein